VPAWPILEDITVNVKLAVGNRENFTAANKALKRV
jgi:hypothetical protein